MNRLLFSLKTCQTSGIKFPNIFSTHIRRSDSWKDCSPICVGQIPENNVHPYVWIKFQKICFTHVRCSNSWKYFPPICVGQIPENMFHPYALVIFLKHIYPCSIFRQNLIWGRTPVLDLGVRGEDHIPTQQHTHTPAHPLVHWPNKKATITLNESM